MKTVIKQLTEAFGPSGYETEVTELIKTMVEEHMPMK
jgi:putative aminopeptidase FrvX